MRCIEPPRDPTQPLMRQCISHSMRFQIAALRQIGTVRAMARVDADRVVRSAAQQPTAAASWPITRWIGVFI